ncbi:unknown [Clostridium sp. CAG:813]|nr:unknown [Clostridium sp. CAG:813]
MDLALQQRTPDLEYKIQSTIEMFKLSKLENLLSNWLEEMPNDSPVNYIGELNKNDVMH